MKSILVFTLCLVTSFGYSQADFIATFKTDNLGNSSNTSVAFPITSASGYQVDFDNNGDLLGPGESTVHTTNFVHDFGTAGTYTVRIVGNMDRILYNNSSANDKDKIVSIEQWGTASLWTNMSYAFDGCLNLFIPATDAPDLTSCTDMTGMFRNAANFNSSVNHWNVSSITKMSSLFYGASSFNQPLNNWNVSSVTNISYMFNGASSFNQPLDNWDVSSVTTLHRTFFQATSFNQAINTWDVSSVFSFLQTFYEAFDFNQPLSNWDVTSGVSMNHMFHAASSFNQPLDNWDVSNVTTMTFMFKLAASFNQPLSSWDVSNVGNMNQMFRGATSFNQPLSSWDVSNVGNMNQMFLGATSFNQPLNSWDLFSVTNINGMFSEASSFNQPLNNWSFPNVTTLGYVFPDATSFNQSLGSWDISNITDMTNMLQNSGLDCVNYDSTLIGWEAQGVSGITLVATGISYDQSQSARDSLINTYGWTITGDSYDAGCHLLTLPVELVSFDAKLSANQVELHWETVTEFNSDYFIVQRSIDGQTWEHVADVKAIENSTESTKYSARDERPMGGISYYRLKQVDLDGAYEYSEIRTIENEGKSVFVYPNPTNGVLYLQNGTGKFDYQLISPIGDIVVSGSGWSETVVLDLTDYSSGVYILKVKKIGKGEVFRIIKD